MKNTVIKTTTMTMCMDMTMTMDTTTKTMLYSDNLICILIAHSLK